MNILFLDESGDHNLSKIDVQYPLFVLGGIITDQKYAEGEMTEAVSAFKRRLFGRDDLILHTADITRNRNGFERLQDTAFRERFYRELNDLMRDLEYRVVACVIRKRAHLTRYGLAALDPYLLSLDILVERFCMDIGSLPKNGMIIAEKRGPTLDRQLELAWLNLRIQGTQYMQAVEVDRRIQALTLRGKTENIAGLQLADLVVSPIGQCILGKAIKEDYRIVESKYRKNWRGEHEGFGLIVLPKK